MADILDSMVVDAIAVIPDDSSIEILEGAKGSSADVFEKLTDKMNSEISKAILGQTLTTELGSKGSFAASKTHMDVRKEIVTGDKKLVEKTLNQLIHWIYALNYNEKDIPLFEMYEEEDVDLTLSQRDKILSDTGVKFTKAYLMKAYGFDEEDIEMSGVLTEPQKKTDSKQFSQEKSEFPDQQAIDNFKYSDKELQKQAESILASVIKQIKDGLSYEEIYAQLSEQGLDTEEIESQLQKALFISEAWGRINYE